jgi:hypothetical protein
MKNAERTKIKPARGTKKARQPAGADAFTPRYNLTTELVPAIQGMVSMRRT